MSIEEHPTVRAFRASAAPVFAERGKISTALIKKIALECGADDAGVVEVTREALQPQLHYIKQVFAKTKTLVSIIIRTNRAPVRSPTRSVANEEYHAGYDHVNDTCRKMVRELAKHGIEACNPVAAFPMEVDQPRIFFVQHKPIAVEAGVGRVGIHRSIIHPKFGSFILLGTVLIDAEVDEYDRPIDYNPCLECKLCVAACPVNAIKPDGYFDFQTCFTHNYHDFLGNFELWAESIADAKDAKDFRAKVPSDETHNVWQSLSFKPAYKAAYCISVCPAGEDVIGPFLENKQAFMEEILKPLTDKAEIIYVITGSDAEAFVPRRFPNKTIRKVRAGRRTKSIQGYWFSLPLSFQRRQAKGLDLTVHFTFDDKTPVLGTVQISNGKLQVKGGKHVGTPTVQVQVTGSTWLSFLNRDIELSDVLSSDSTQISGKTEDFHSLLRCFPF